MRKEIPLGRQGVQIPKKLIDFFSLYFFILFLFMLNKLNFTKKKDILYWLYQRNEIFFVEI